MERAKGIEPSYEAWEASVLPLNYARVPEKFAHLVINKIKHLASDRSSNLP